MQSNQNQGDWLPTRLLDVTRACETGMLGLVLPYVHTKEFIPVKQYMILGHCWGTWGSITLSILTFYNLSGRQDTGLDIPLFKTSKEAFRGCRVVPVSVFITPPPQTHEIIQARVRS